jgi:hypothetical protein
MSLSGGSALKEPTAAVESRDFEFARTGVAIVIALCLCRRLAVNDEVLVCQA